MKVVIIGCSGHYSYALEDIKNDRDASVAGIAPGSEGEDMSVVYQEVCNLGYTPRLFDDYISMLDEVKPDIAVINCFWTSCQGDDASTEKGNPCICGKAGCHHI